MTLGADREEVARWARQCAEQRQMRSVTQKGARQTDKLLGMPLRGIQWICVLICEPIIHRQLRKASCVRITNPRDLYRRRTQREDIQPVVCGVAREVCYQKFAKCPGLAELLLATGGRLMVEAARNDRVWGIGLDRGRPEVATPAQWRGSNVLGWALMQARARLRAEAEARGR